MFYADDTDTNVYVEAGVPPNEAIVRDGPMEDICNGGRMFQVRVGDKNRELVAPKAGQSITLVYVLNEMLAQLAK